MAGVDVVEIGQRKGVGGVEKTEGTSRVSR